GDGLVGAMAGKKAAQCVSSGTVIISDVIVVEYLHSQSEELFAFFTPRIVQIPNDSELIAFALAVWVVGQVKRCPGFASTEMDGRRWVTYRNHEQRAGEA